MKARYEVRTRGKQWIVYDRKGKVNITKAIPEKQIADEIAEDFNRMEKKDFRPIGMPDFSTKFN